MENRKSLHDPSLRFEGWARVLGGVFGVWGLVSCICVCVQRNTLRLKKTTTMILSIIVKPRWVFHMAIMGIPNMKLPYRCLLLNAGDLVSRL